MARVVFLAGALIAVTVGTVAVNEAGLPTPAAIVGNGWECEGSIHLS